jgi:rhamnosyltransferase
MNEPRVSIVIRSFNEAWALAGTLAALEAQAYENWELIVFDSGSTDGSVDLIRRAEPRHFVQLLPAEYNPSRVMNQAMRLAESDYVIFLNADATPQGSQWLESLIRPLLDFRNAAVFSRQIPRPDCHAVFACDYERCFGSRRESAHWDHFFSMVSSGLRKDVWAKRGFLENLQFAEDHEYTRWCKAQGYRIVFCPESVVMHSHNYTPEQAYRRSFGDARALAKSSRTECKSRWLRMVPLGWISDLRHDLLFCLRHRRLTELAHAARIRWQQRRGKFDGLKAGSEERAKVVLRSVECSEAS